MTDNQFNFAVHAAVFVFIVIAANLAAYFGGAS
jgi:hypothetical protein